MFIRYLLAFTYYIRNNVFLIIRCNSQDGKRSAVVRETSNDRFKKNLTTTIKTTHIMRIFICFKISFFIGTVFLILIKKFNNAHGEIITMFAGIVRAARKTLSTPTILFSICFFYEIIS